MGVLSGLSPALVWKYFEQICGIPHGSGNEEQISKYLEDFAKNKGLQYVRDSANNVVIWAPGSAGYEDHEPVILQGHMDMVAQKDPDCTIDMELDGLQLILDGDVVTANGTTLGGDDGIAVAYMLAILDDSTSSDPTIKHPPLECVITTDEEGGMTGAASLDMKLLKSHKMINLDSEDEGYLLVSCAGGVRTRMSFNTDRTAADGDYTQLRVTISGLRGGHSGCDIHLGRANADVLMGQLLKAISAKTEVKLFSINGGDKDNVIPKLSEAIIGVSDSEVVDEVIASFVSEVAKKFAETDPDIKINAEPTNYDGAPMSDVACNNIIEALTTWPCGVLKMSEELEGLPETSLSLGVVQTDEEAVKFSYLIRSNVDESKDALRDRMQNCAQELGAAFTFDGDYPGWKYCKESELREVMYNTFEEVYGKAPVVQAIHAGVECGMFAKAIDNFDAVSIGPDMSDIHTSSECLYVASTARTWDYLLAVLARL